MMNALDVNRALLEITERDLGISEWPGAKHNPAILAFGVPDDETPWCAAWMNAKLGELGIPHPGRLNARSYATWGTEVALEHAVPGDTVVFWRGSRQSWQGHVAIFLRREGDRIVVRGGNQGNAVSDAPYPVSRVLTIRRWDGVRPDADASGRPVLRAGNRSRDPFVVVLQEMLAEHGFFSGRRDGLFGPRTRSAVIAFQAENGFAADGIVGPQTWAALKEARPTRTEREIETAELREKGSRTIEAADRIETAAGKGGLLARVTVGAGAAWGSVASLDEASEALDGAESVMETASRLLVAYWPLLVLAALAVALWRHEALLKHGARLVRQFRTDDARTGANDRL